MWFFECGFLCLRRGLTEEIKYQAGPFALLKNMLEGCTSFGICEIKSSVTLWAAGDSLWRGESARKRLLSLLLATYSFFPFFSRDCRRWQPNFLAAWTRCLIAPRNSKLREIDIPGDVTYSLMNGAAETIYYRVGNGIPQFRNLNFYRKKYLVKNKLSTDYITLLGLYNLTWWNLLLGHRWQ